MMGTYDRKASVVKAIFINYKPTTVLHERGFPFVARTFSERREKKKQRSRARGYLFLLHQLGVGAIVDDVSAKDWGRQISVYFLGVDVFEFSIQNEFVSCKTKGDSRLLAEEDKGEDISELETNVSEQPAANSRQRLRNRVKDVVEG